MQTSNKYYILKVYLKDEHFGTIYRGHEDST